MYLKKKIDITLYDEDGKRANSVADDLLKYEIKSVKLNRIK